MNKGILYTSLSIVFMSLGPTINKFALARVSPFTLVLYNALLCCMFTFPFIYKKLLKVSPEEVKSLAMAGILNGVSMFFLFYGLSKSSPAIVSMLNRTYIIFSILIGAFFLKEYISKLDWGLIIVSTLGIILFMIKKEMAQAHLGALYGIMSGLLFAFCNMTIKNKLKETCEYVILFSINFTSALFFFIVISVFQGREDLVLPLEPRTLSFVFLGAFLGSFLGLLLFYASIKTIPFYKANLYRSISPVVSLFVGLMFFPVSLSTLNIIGLVILVSSFIVYSTVKVKIMKKKSLEMVMTDKIPDSYKSVLVFIKEDKNWLMVRNKFRSWEFPGGHKENNETPFETATREAYEEAGVEVRNLKYVGFYSLASDHTTLIITAEVEKLHEIPEEFETVERKFVSELPKSLSFNDAVYPWLIKNLC